VLDGELNHRTAHALEVEIERLHDEGVTDITLDLSRLSSIDRVGVAVIAFRCQLSTRRGFGFQLIAGSERVQREFRAAGVAETLPFVLPNDESEAVSEPVHAEQEVSG
jgi:anti-anti-sigma factor